MRDSEKQRGGTMDSQMMRRMEKGVEEAMVYFPWRNFTQDFLIFMTRMRTGRIVGQKVVFV